MRQVITGLNKLCRCSSKCAASLAGSNLLHNWGIRDILVILDMEREFCLVSKSVNLSHSSSAKGRLTLEAKIPDQVCSMQLSGLLALSSMFTPLEMETGP
jgi:hypothetical protein